MNTVATIPAPPPVSECGCGRSFSLLEWNELPPARGGFRDGWSNLEYRNCPCGSTHTIALDDCAEAAE